MKNAIDTVLSTSRNREIILNEQRLKDIDNTRINYIYLIATGTFSADYFDEEFVRIVYLLLLKKL